MGEARSWGILSILLLLAVLPPLPAAEGASSPAACSATTAAVNLTFTPRSHLPLAQADLDFVDRGCGHHQSVELNGVVDVHGVEGIVRYATSAATDLGVSPTGPPKELPSSVAFSASFTLTLREDCRDPEGEARAQVEGVTVLVPFDTGLAAAACAELGAAQHAPAFAAHLLDVLARAVFALAPSAAEAMHDASQLLAAVPTEVEAAGVHVRLPTASVAPPSDDDDRVLAVSGHAQGEAGAGGARMDAGADAAAPFAGLSPAAPAPSPPVPPTAPAARAPAAAPAPRDETATPPAAPAPLAATSPAAAPAVPEPRGERAWRETEAAAPSRPPAAAPEPSPAAPVRALAQTTGGPLDAPRLPPTAAIALGLGASALLVTLLSLYQRVARPSALEHPLRAAVHRALAMRAAPATAGEVAREVGVGRKTAEYHLAYLARLGLLLVARDADGVSRYRTPATPSAAPRDPLAEALVALVAARPGLSTREAAEALALTRPRAERRLRDLVQEQRLQASLEHGQRLFYPN